jgi:glycerol-3-phosphate cytidylyltransferase
MKVGVTAGAFPILHPGYIHLFQECKKNCDKLIVLLHDDPSAERKNKKSPIFTLQARKDLLLSLRSVDEVREYATENELCLLLQELSPAVRFLGEDYKNSPITGDHLNIPIHWVSRSHGWSTTKVIDLIKERL